MKHRTLLPLLMPMLVLVVTLLLLLGAQALADPTTAPTTAPANSDSASVTFTERDPKTGNYVQVTDPQEIARLRKKFDQINQTADELTAESHMTPDQLADKQARDFDKIEAQATSNAQQHSDRQQAPLLIWVVGPIAIIAITLVAYLARKRGREVGNPNGSDGGSSSQ